MGVLLIPEALVKFRAVHSDSSVPRQRLEFHRRDTDCFIDTEHQGPQRTNLVFYEDPRSRRDVAEAAGIGL